MLRYLRPWRGIRMVWVDAICINQEDMQERGDQVAKMGQLYTGCFQVFLWLGDDIAFRRPGIYPPRLPLHELENLEELQLPSKKERVNIRSLFERRYFRRVWIIQELILPPRIAIPIGDKVFWVDPFTATHFERLPSRDWLWEQTGAPWFQHATRGTLLTENLSGLVTLTWKSQSSDTRDKVYGVMGLSMKEGIQIRPDYGISLQHLLIGFFAHCIIRGGTPQLLLKAAGASTEADMPSWMPFWKGDAWERLFSSSNEENPPWERVRNKFAEVKWRLQYQVFPLSTMTENTFSTDPWKGEKRKQYRMVRFLPGSHFRKKNWLRKTVFDRRPWHQDATVDADTGAISLNLTRLVSITSRPVRAEVHQKEQCRIYHTEKYGTGDYICFMSRSQLDKVVEAGDDIFLLDDNARTPIYLILRKTDNSEEFRLIATCPHLTFLFVEDSAESIPDWEALPLGDLQASLYTDLKRLHGLGSSNSSDYEYCPDSSDSSDYEDSEDPKDLDDPEDSKTPEDSSDSENSEVSEDSEDSKRSDRSFHSFRHVRKGRLFPGRCRRVTFKEVLSLLLGIAKHGHEDKLKSWKSFQELYLESIDPEFQPRVSNGFCKMSLNAEDKEEIDELLGCHAYGIGWIKEQAKDDAGRVVLRRDMEEIKEEMSRVSESPDPLGLLDGLVDMLEDADVGERIMAGPVEEDRFRAGTHLGREVLERYGLSAVFKRFGLDGSTFRVRIV
ncbi:hypothetical protein BHE90_005891 [Fusarium euwallaceae]|uniref:Heterokaryon incompatibility domain-containing protein n=1 Tax=Fusarium euwallaceae TaxID=1147111 RepID=A0A430LVE5_9HYPO|nr:hypothetical protein BHE90_005891 [Fusarium euwallaceae]